jgi:hypothetical protein
VIGDIAAAFHFPPSEIWAMNVDEVCFWHGQALRIGRERRD